MYRYEDVRLQKNTNRDQKNGWGKRSTRKFIVSRSLESVQGDGSYGNLHAFRLKIFLLGTKPRVNKKTKLNLKKKTKKIQMKTILIGKSKNLIY